MNMVLFLSDVAGSEILLILLFVLIFFGSKSIPNLARTLGKTIHQIKNASEDLQQEIKQSGLDMKKDMNFSEVFRDTSKTITDPIEANLYELDNVINAPSNVQSYAGPQKVETEVKPDQQLEGEA
jgi:sec-independent protein translocase protein TatA